MVDNVLPLRTATFLRNFILHRRKLTDFSGAGFPGHQGKPPKWYYNAFMQCLGGIVLETFGINVAGKRPGGFKGKKCPKDMTPPEKDPACVMPLPLRPSPPPLPQDAPQSSTIKRG